MRTRRAVVLRFALVFGVLGAAGLASLVYLVFKQNGPVPFRDVYTVRAQFSAANGVVGGIGQPVNVAGVRVGRVAGVDLSDGRAIVELEIERHMLRSLHADATAALEPITPLKDMQIDLNPGTQGAGTMPDGGMLGVDRTSSPAELSDLLSALDGDTRAFLAAFLDAMGRGTRGRAEDINRALRSLGPTAAQVRRISRAVGGRRQALASLVHNLGILTRAGARDRRLAEVIASGNATLNAIAEQEAPLRRALAKLPSTLAVTRATLTNVRPFSRELQATVEAVEPAVKRLPATLAALGPFAVTGTAVLRDRVRPLVRDAAPLVDDLRPTVSSLTGTTPRLTEIFRVLEYVTNEVAYNPPGDDEGVLFWIAWFMHNMNSVTSASDAHGGIARGGLWLSCQGLEHQPQIQAALGVVGVCPN